MQQSVRKDMVDQLLLLSFYNSLMTLQLCWKLFNNQKNQDFIKLNIFLKSSYCRKICENKKDRSTKSSYDNINREDDDLQHCKHINPLKFFASAHPRLKSLLLSQCVEGIVKGICVSVYLFVWGKYLHNSTFAKIIVVSEEWEESQRTPSFESRVARRCEVSNYLICFDSNDCVGRC